MCVCVYNNLPGIHFDVIVAGNGHYIQFFFGGSDKRKYSIR